MMKNIIDQFGIFEKFILCITIFVSRHQYYEKSQWRKITREIKYQSFYHRVIQ